MTSAERQAFEAGHPGWHLWESDEGHLYAVKVNKWEMGATVDGETEDKVDAEVRAAETRWRKAA